MEIASAEVESTYKNRDVESAIDIAFYRPLGFKLAQVFASIRATPAFVTALSGTVGVVAGHLYYYDALALNVAGMLLHVLANALDNADGQLARLTRSGSREGRIRDGIADNVVFASVYLHLGFRILHTHPAWMIGIIVIAAAASHSAQSCVGDLVRNCYMRFAGRNGEIDMPDEIAASRAHATGVQQKLLLRIYGVHLAEQNRLMPALFAFVRSNPSDRARDEYVRQTRPVLPLTNAVATNPRMLLLFAVLLLRQPIWYFIAQLTAFNAVGAWLILQQRQLARRLSMNER